MIDIPTGYFFLTTSGSVILGIGVAIVLAKLLGFGSKEQSTESEANRAPYYFEKVDENQDR